MPEGVPRAGYGLTCTGKVGFLWRTASIALIFRSKGEMGAAADRDDEKACLTVAFESPPPPLSTAHEPHTSRCALTLGMMRMLLF